MTHLDHVALLVPHLEPALERLGDLAEWIGPIEEFPSEGTREVYIGEGPGKLLLLEPISSSGPYARALAKRGPGLHHVALNTSNLDAFLAEVRGWLLHPVSLETVEKSRTAWFARPGVPTLLEVHESAASPSTQALVRGIEVPGDLEKLTPRAGLSPSPDGETRLTIHGVRRSARDLATGTTA